MSDPVATASFVVSFAGYSVALPMTAHDANILVHVVCGLAAFVIGLWILASRKGDRAHVRRGRWFLWVMAAALGTAAIGAVLFRAAPTLIAITLLVTYEIVSGVRAARGRPPTWVDNTFAVVGVAAAGVFIWYLSTGEPTLWRPQVTIPIAATLLIVAGYDLVRLAAPRWRARIYPLEHALKMIGAMSGLLAAGVGNVAVAWQPWSQILPSAFGSLFAIAYVVVRGRAALALRRPDKV